jgi:hypothetical protein
VIVRYPTTTLLKRIDPISGETTIKSNNFVISKRKKDISFIPKSREDLLEEGAGEQTDFVVNSAGEYSSGAEYASDTCMNNPAT